MAKSWTGLSDFTFTFTFPGGSEVKASACNAGDLGSIPGLERSPGEGNGNPLQYSCLENPMDRGACVGAILHRVAKSRTRLHFLSMFYLGPSQVALMVKNMPASAEDLSWEDALEEGMATHSSILAWRIPWTAEPGRLQSMGS